MITVTLNEIRSHSSLQSIIQNKVKYWNISVRRFFWHFECWSKLGDLKLFVRYFWLGVEKRGMHFWSAFLPVICCGCTTTHLKWSRQVWNGVQKWNHTCKGKKRLSAGNVLANLFWGPQKLYFSFFFMIEQLVLQSTGQSESNVSVQKMWCTNAQCVAR